MTQAAFARRLGVTVKTLSNWERAIHTPTDAKALVHLRNAAAEAGLTAEQKLFEDEVSPSLAGFLDHDRIDLQILEAVGSKALAIRLHSIADWHCHFATRIALTWFPEVAKALHEALQPTRKILNEIVQEEAPPDGQLDLGFYNRLALRVDELAARKIFRFDSTTGLVKRRDHKIAAAMNNQQPRDSRN
jgi:transcriptional regulator with XRE-family HTH domain